MNINLIKENNDLMDVSVCGRNVIETFRAKKADRSLIRIFVYDPHNSSRKEIAPEIEKYEKIPVINGIWNSEDVFFASVMPDNKSTLAVYRYSVQDDKTDRIAVFGDILPQMLECDRIKIFALERALFLIQVEKLSVRDVSSGKGRLTFQQKLVNTDTGEEVVCVDPNLVNNGVNTIKALSPTHIMMKTGYSYLEDVRLRPHEAEDALIESVYYGPMSQLISSIGMESGTTGYTMLRTAYHEKSICGVRTGGDYIFFSMVEPDEHRSETIFYNFKTDETLRAQSVEVDESDPDTAMVAYNIPFIRQDLPDEIKLINIRTSLTDSLFFENEIAGVLGDLIILRNRKGHKEVIRGYVFPRLELAFEQKGRYLTGCINCEEYYVYYSGK